LEFSQTVAIAEVSMKRVPGSIFCGVLLMSVAWGQNSPANDPQAPAASQSAVVKRIASGSVIPVTLTKTVDAKKAKVGEPVTAKVTSDLKSNAGEVLLAKNTKVIGHITEVQPRTKEQKESQLAIEFDQTVANDGAQMQMPMSIQAIISFQNNSSNNAGQDSTGGASQPSVGGGSGPVPGGRSMGGSSAPASASSSGGMNDSGAPAGSSSNSRPAITAQTQGVIGISNLTLNPASTPAQGSILSSEKNNVKLESDTMMLLRVD
jgi:hypothetical protein